MAEAGKRISRQHMPAPPAPIPHPRGLRLLTVGGVSLNLDGLHATVAGRTVPLAMREFDVLKLLMEQAGKVLTRREILDECWGAGYPDHNKTLETHVVRLRHKLSAAASGATPIRTVRGVGYVFDLPT